MSHVPYSSSSSSSIIITSTLHRAQPSLQVDVSKYMTYTVRVLEESGNVDDDILRGNGPPFRRSAILGILGLGLGLGSFRYGFFQGGLCKSGWRYTDIRL